MGKLYHIAATLEGITRRLYHNVWQSTATHKDSQGNDAELSRSATLTVALSNATDKEKGGADIVCGSDYAADYDQLAFNAAVAALPSLGGKIKTTSGQANISDKIDYGTKDSVTLEGQGGFRNAAGEAATLFQVVSGANLDAVFTMSDARINAGHVFRGFAIDGNSGNQTSGNGVGIVLRALKSIIDDVNIEDMYGMGVQIIGYDATDKAQENMVRNSFVRNCGGSGLKNDNFAADNHFTNLILSESPINLDVTYGKITAIAVHCGGATTDCLNALKISANASFGKYIGCYFDTCQEHLIVLDSTDGQIYCNDFIGCHYASPSQKTVNTYDYVYATAGGGTNAIIWNKWIGGDFDKISGTHVDARYFFNFSDAYCYNNQIDGAFIYTPNIDTGVINNPWAGANVITKPIYYNSFSGIIESISKTIDHASLTDGGDATAYMDFGDAIPAGCIVKAVKCDFTEAFNSDDTTTLTMMIGSQADLDALNKTADPGEDAFNHTTDVFWGESACQDPVVTASYTPRVTFTEDDDGTDIISSANAQGGVTITITYMKA